MRVQDSERVNDQEQNTDRRYGASSTGCDQEEKQITRVIIAKMK